MLEDAVPGDFQFSFKVMDAYTFAEGRRDLAQPSGVMPGI